MIIADQLTLFFKKIRETQANSKLSAEEGLDYINDSRQTEAAETRFYDIKDTVTADGGETYWTLRDDFLGLQAARDCVTCNGKAVTIKTLAEWATITDGTVLNVLAADERWGMMHGNTFYVYPAAVAGDVMVWWGYGEPPELAAITGPDVYLNNTQARLTVLGAAIAALEDTGELPGQALVGQYVRLKKIVSKRGQPRGPRLEFPPEG